MRLELVEMDEALKAGHCVDEASGMQDCAFARDECDATANSVARICLDRNHVDVRGALSRLSA